MSDWDRLRDALGDLLELPEPARDAELERWVERDPELAHELRRLVAAATEEGGFLGASAVERVAASRTRAATPTRLGPWRLEQPIGSGGMGEVWRGRRADGAFEQVVAIKLVRADLARGIGDRRLAAERRILAGLEHPGIARLIDGGTSPDGLDYLVLEHVDGEPIDAWSNRRKLPLDARLALFVEVCKAVDYAHRKLVLHRDLKPSNVLVDAAGRAKLLDFGIAKLLDPSAGGSEETLADGPRPMTPAWASPEQLRGEALTLASDVWALGLLLCLLVAGRRPVIPESDSSAGLARALEEQGAPRLAELASGGAAPGVDARRLDGDLARVVARALDSDPALRYRSAAELAADIEAFRSDRPVSAHAPSFSYRAGKFVRRHAVAVALSAAALGGLVVSTAVSVTQARRAGLERARAERRLADLRELSGRFLFDFEFQLRDLAGATGLRRDVTNVSLRYLDLLANEAGDDPKLLADLAHGFYQLGLIQGSATFPSLGDGAGAAASAERALELARRLEAIAPGGFAASLALAEGHILRADLLAGRAEYAAADRDLIAAIDAARRAQELDPAHDLARRLFISSLARRGSVAVAAGRIDDAVAAHRASYEASRELARADPEALERNVYVNRMLYGEALAAAGRVDEALAELEPAFQAAESRLRREPQNGGVARELSAAIDRTVVARLAAGRVDEALALAERGLTLAEGLAALDSDNELGRSDVVASRSQVAAAALRAGELALAEREFRRAIAETEELLAPDPTAIGYRTFLGELRLGLADVAARRGQRDEARRRYEAAAADCLEILAAAPEQAAVARQLAEIRLRLATLD